MQQSGLVVCAGVIQCVQRHIQGFWNMSRPVEDDTVNLRVGVFVCVLNEQKVIC